MDVRSFETGCNAWKRVQIGSARATLNRGGPWQGMVGGAILRERKAKSWVTPRNATQASRARHRWGSLGRTVASRASDWCEPTMPACIGSHRRCSFHKRRFESGMHGDVILADSSKRPLLGHKACVDVTDANNLGSSGRVRDPSQRRPRTSGGMPRSRRSIGIAHRPRALFAIARA